MAQSGIDLNTYPTNFDKYYLIAYGILGETMDLDPNKTYDYHRAFDIKPTEVVYNAGHRVGFDFCQKFAIIFPAHGQIIPVKSNQISPPQAAHCCQSQGRT